MMDALCKKLRHQQFLEERKNRFDGNPFHNLMLEEALLTSLGRWTAWSGTGIYTESFYIRTLKKFNFFVENLNVHLVAIKNVMNILSNELWHEYFRITRTDRPQPSAPYLAFHDIFYLRRNTFGKVEAYVDIDRIDSIADITDRTISVTFRCKGFRPLTETLRLEQYIVSDEKLMSEENIKNVNSHFLNLLGIFTHGRTEGL